MDLSCIRDEADAEGGPSPVLRYCESCAGSATELSGVTASVTAVGSIGDEDSLPRLTTSAVPVAGICAVVVSGS